MLGILLTATGSQSRLSEYAQLVTVLFIFVAVLGVTAWVTKWMANYQKQQNSGKNMEVLDTLRISNNKWIQLVRVGCVVKVIAICKDTVTYLGEVDIQLINTESGREQSDISEGFKSQIQKAIDSLKENNKSKE